jgi:hypothetical protein
MDFSRFRPWILVIEATKPNSTEEIHDEWEGDVLSADYLLAYIDGLNRFYVAKEQSELLNPLRYPPNVFDGFIRSEQMDSELRAQQAEAKAQQAEAKAQQAEAKAQQAEAKAQQAEAKAQQAEAKAQQAEIGLIALHNSSSWRLTAPLRKIITMGNSLVRMPKTVRSKIKDKIKLLLAHIKLYINQRPRLRRAILNSPRLRFFAIWVINRYPRLRFVVRNLMGIEIVRLNARSFDTLTSVKIMSAMSKSLVDTTNNDSVIFLQVTHEE